jgi:hypothetical protein
MKKLFQLTILLLTLAIAAPSALAEKKRPGWKDGKMPELTKVKDIDTYLLTCDSLITNLNAIDENTSWFEVKKVQVTNEDGTSSEVYHVVDQFGTIRGKDESLQQTLAIINICTLCPLNAANIAVQTPLYVTALPQLGLNAFKYAKYSKLGPQLAAHNTTVVPETLKKLRKQWKAIHALKKMTNDQGELLDPSIDLTNVDGVDLSECDTIVKTSSEVEAELAKAITADQQTGSIDESAFDDI